MRSPLRLLSLVLLSVVAGCGKGSSPTGPSSTTSTSTPTRIIAVSGNLAFGDVPVGGQRDLSYTITNSGNATLTVTGTTVSGGLSSYLTASWTRGTIAPGASQTVSVRFSPTASGAFSGVVTVNGDQTGGSNTVPISAMATAPPLDGVWSGRYIVDRCDGTGSVQDYFCSARGVFPPGTSLPIALSLTQNGSSVTGTFSLGQVTGVANGTVNAGGTLVLQGTATSGTLTAQLSSWSTTVSGSSMTGTFTYNASIGGIPGVAVVVSRLSGVTRR
ncbi:MAG: choice-of-anchor D domain-containing protein [Vicinamibacterales bacterium]